MSEMQSGTAAVAMDTETSDDGDAVDDNPDPSAEQQQLPTPSDEMTDAVGNVTAEADTERFVTDTSESDSITSPCLPTPADIIIDTETDVLSSDHVAPSSTGDNTGEASVRAPTPASEPSSATASVSCRLLAVNKSAPSEKFCQKVVAYVPRNTVPLVIYQTVSLCSVHQHEWYCIA